MTEHLVFRLYGPMVSWGDIAVGEERPTISRPTKSAIMGLVAGAWGLYRKDHDEEHSRLYESTGYAVEVKTPGVPLRDFHTAQVPKNRRNVRWFTRKDELQRDKSDVNTILSNREYLNDALYTVCLWKRDAEDYPLLEIKEKLNSPHFVPYLGRKSCSPALPFYPQIIDSSTLYEAFQQAEFPDIPEFPFLEEENEPTYYWDKDHPDHGLEIHQEQRTRDRVVSRDRWQFGNRQEYFGTSGTEKTIEE